MTTRKIVYTSDAPEAIGPYSQGIITGETLYVSGQIPLDPQTGSFAGDDISSQTYQVMNNVKAIVEAAGSSMSKVIKCSIFLADMGDFATVNQIYGSYFGDEPPAREAIAVKTLPKNAKVEVSCIALV